MHLFIKPIVTTVAVVVLAVCVCPQTPLERLEGEFTRLAEDSGGKMGIGCIHIESGHAAYLNADEPFPMASSYKVAIATQLMHRVDQGKLSLDKMITVRPGDLSPGSGELGHLLDDPGVVLSVHNLLELMLLISDNSATDMCLTQAGGAKDVTKRMKEIGCEGIRVDRSTYHLIADYVGFKRRPDREELSKKVLVELSEEVSEEEQKAAAKAFAADARDAATPRAMAKLLRLLWTDQAVKPESCAVIRDIMSRCETGETRLKGLLPAGTPVAHKTGTIGGATNDVGVITLPGNAGHVIVAAFVKDSTKEIPERERAIAEVARAAHDFFLFNAE